MTARAIFEKILIPSKFSDIYLRSILRKRNGINQMASFDRELYSQLRKIKEFESVEDVKNQNSEIKK